jgi:hypothetical protein
MKPGAVRGRTGDIAHLEPGQYFAFCSPCQVFSLFIRLAILKRFTFPLHLSLSVWLNSAIPAAQNLAQPEPISPSGETAYESCVGFCFGVFSCVLLFTCAFP